MFSYVFMKYRNRSVGWYQNYLGIFNPFLPNGPFLYKGPLGRNGLIWKTQEMIVILSIPQVHGKIRSYD